MTASLRIGFIVTTLLALANGAAAQSLLYAEHEGAFRLVTQVDRNIPMVVEGDKLVPGSRTRFSLRPVARYAPWYVTVRKPSATARHAITVGTGETFNYAMEFTAEFETGYPLDNVYVVLQVRDNRGNETIAIGEVGKLRPREAKAFKLEVQVAERMDEAPYTLHIFSNGAEGLHSQLPADVITKALDGMVAEKLQGAKDGPPRPLLGPPPLYPEALFKTRVAGKAMVSLEVSPTGTVLNPAVTEASDPAFGEAALAAIREWRFVPKVKGGQPVAAKVSLPFAFSPPREQPAVEPQGPAQPAAK